MFLGDSVEWGENTEFNHFLNFAPYPICQSAIFTFRSTGDGPFGASGCNVAFISALPLLPTQILLARFNFQKTFLYPILFFVLAGLHFLKIPYIVFLVLGYKIKCLIHYVLKGRNPFVADIQTFLFAYYATI